MTIRNPSRILVGCLAAVLGISASGSSPLQAREVRDEQARTVQSISQGLYLTAVEGALVEGSPAASDASEGTAFLPLEDGSGWMAVRRDGGVSGDDVLNAAVGIDPYTKEHVLNLELDEAGKRKLADLTRASLGRAIAIIIDGEIISAPVVREPILGGAVQINGGFSAERANELAMMLRAAASPGPAEIREAPPVE